MKKKILAVFVMFFLMSMTACSSTNHSESTNQQTQILSNQDGNIQNAEIVIPSMDITELVSGLSVVRFEGNDGFSEFLLNGGASSDGEVVSYIVSSMINGAGDLIFQGNPFGCSTIAAVNDKDEYLFGRNFDWYNCEALIVESYPDDAYASISTVNTDFIRQGAGAASAAFSVDSIMTIASLYAPIDGMNEKGLAVSVNMIQDSDTIAQDSDLPDITTTTAVRMLLNKAASVDEAVALLKEYDLHASFGFMVHLAVADAKGNSAVIEYVNQKMIVTKTPVVTNFYLSEGEKYGIGTSQSQERYETLINTLDDSSVLSEAEVADALESVSKHHYSDGETTEWSVVFNLTIGEVVYFHREDYTKAYRIALEIK